MHPDLIHSVTFGYQDRRREDRTLADLEVRCLAGRIQEVRGRTPDGRRFVHPEPEKLAFVLDRRADIAYPRHEPVPAPRLLPEPAARSA